MVVADGGREHLESVMEYIDHYCQHGFEGQLLPLIPGEKSPVWGVRSKEPLPCVMADCGRTKMTRERLLDYWSRQPLCNLGLLTGRRSGIVAVDFDRPKADDPRAHRRFAEVIELVRHGQPLPGVGPSDTACYETIRGVHLLFKRPCALSGGVGVVLTELGLPVDLKGEGGLVVVPPSEIAGWTRKFLRNLHCLKPLPMDAEVVRRTLKDEMARYPLVDRATVPRLPTFHVKDLLCAKALAESDIPEGERDKTLLVLYNVLRRADNSPEHAERVVRLVNDRLRSPMTATELQKCFRKYNYSCMGITQMLPDIKSVCLNCKMKRQRERRLTEVIDLDEVERICRANVPKTALGAYLFDRSGRARTRREMAIGMGVSERAVYDGLKRLRKETGIEVS